MSELMETWELTQKQQEYFLNQPETGMGYQVFDSYIKDEDSAIISNCRFGTKESSTVNRNAVRTSIPEYESHNQGLADLVFFDRLEKYNERVYNRLIEEVENGEILPSFIYQSKAGDEFRRLSAYKDDKRVLPDGSLVEGSYGTSTRDLDSVPSGIAAVGRYALPNRLAACYVYQIIPPEGTKILFGTVSPNYGLCGGGVEVFFPAGCPEGSARLIGTISLF